MTRPNPAPSLKLLPPPPPSTQPSPYTGRIITLELADGTVLELAISNVVNMSTREDADLERNSVSIFDGLGNQLHRSSFARWKDRFNSRKNGGAA